MSAPTPADPVSVREARADEDDRVASHFYRMWRDNDVAAERIVPDWQARIRAFVDAARRDLGYRAFVAETGGRVIGSAACQLFAGPYPDILAPAQRRYGYIWGVYVDPAERRSGTGRRLTEAAIAYLTAIGCTHALLHAAPSGRSVYAGLGFQSTNEMRLSLE